MTGFGDCFSLDRTNTISEQKERNRSVINIQDEGTKYKYTTYSIDEKQFRVKSKACFCYWRWTTQQIRLKPPRMVWHSSLLKLNRRVIVSLSAALNGAREEPAKSSICRTTTALASCDRHIWGRLDKSASKRGWNVTDQQFPLALLRFILPSSTAPSRDVRSRFLPLQVPSVWALFTLERRPGQEESKNKRDC